MIELVPMAYRVANEVEAGPETTAVHKPGEKESKSGESRMDEEEERDAVFFRLEMLGYRVGQGLVERYVEALTCGGDIHRRGYSDPRVQGDEGGRDWESHHQSA